MDKGDRLYKRVQSTVHSPSLSVEEKKEGLKKDFVYSLGGLPVGMLDELFEVIFFSQSPTEEELLQQAEILPNLTELLLESFDDRRDPFSSEQWRQVGEIVSDFGSELDESLLTYVMSKVVERGVL
jgi:hypothetical protein